MCLYININAFKIQSKCDMQKQKNHFQMFILFNTGIKIMTLAQPECVPQGCPSGLQTFVHPDICSPVELPPPIFVHPYNCYPGHLFIRIFVPPAKITGEQMSG